MWPNSIHSFSKIEDESQGLEMTCPDLTQQNYVPVSDLCSLEGLLVYTDLDSVRLV